MFVAKFFDFAKSVHLVYKFCLGKLVDVVIVKVIDDIIAILFHHLVFWYLRYRDNLRVVSEECYHVPLDGLEFLDVLSGYDADTESVSGVHEYMEHRVAVGQGPCTYLPCKVQPDGDIGKNSQVASEHTLSQIG